MNKPYPFSELKELIGQSQSVTILLANNPRFDHVASALAFKLALEAKGLICSVLSETPMTVEYNRLVGVDTVGRKVNEGRDLVISLNYPLEQIEKVSYNDEGGKLNLVIQPKEGASRVEKNQAEFWYQGGGDDLKVTVGVEDPSRLGKIRQELTSDNLVNIDNSASNTRFGKLNIVDSQASSCSEIMVAIILSLNLPFDQDIANNLYLGIEESTKNFSLNNVGADTFEAAAILLRQGAKKPQPPLAQKPIFEEGIQGFPRAQMPAKARSQPKPFRPTPTPSPDWLEPKIFKSSNIS